MNQHGANMPAAEVELSVDLVRRMVAAQFPQYADLEVVEVANGWDNVVYRLGLADSRAQARQLVQHGHIMLNNRKTNIPSALVAPGDVVSVRKESNRLTYFKDLRQNLDDRRVPRWLTVESATLSGRVVHAPAREDIDISLNEQLIVEYYSR